jgi:hypothetical protein
MRRRQSGINRAENIAINSGIGVCPVLPEDEVEAERFISEKDYRIEEARRACALRREKRQAAGKA